MNDTKITFLEYYQKNYDIEIKDERQPLLVTSDKLNENQIYLIPELCRMTGLDRKSRKNMKKMKSIAKYTRLDPDQRKNHINSLVKRLEKPDN